jgi:peptide/nickel transport system permease protein
VKRYILKRVGYALISLVLLSVTIFLFVRVTGDPAVLLVEPGASQADIDAIRTQFGLDRPLWVQYGHFAVSLLRGDLGHSFYYRMPVLELYLSRLPNSLLLAAAAMAFSLVIGIPTGIIAAVRVNRWWDSAGKVFALLGLSLPSFWVGLLLILFFSVYLRWMPPVVWVDFFTDPKRNLTIMLLPAICLGTASAANIARTTRAGMLDVLRSEYIRTASAKGLSRRLVILKHALKNALIPIVTVAGLQMGILLGGTVVVEEVFTLPGVGRLVLWSIYQRDYPLTQSTILFIAVMFMAINLAVDLLYGCLDPRIRYS